MLRLRQRSPVTDIRVLLRFLPSGFGQAAIQILEIDVVVLGLQMDDVRRLPVFIPSPKMQRVVARDVLHLIEIQGRVRELRREMAEGQQQKWSHDAGLDDTPDKG